MFINIYKLLRIMSSKNDSNTYRIMTLHLNIEFFMPWRAKVAQCGNTAIMRYNKLGWICVEYSRHDESLWSLNNFMRLVESDHVCGWGSILYTSKHPTIQPVLISKGACERILRKEPELQRILQNKQWDISLILIILWKYTSYYPLNVI